MTHVVGVFNQETFQWFEDDSEGVSPVDSIGVNPTDLVANRNYRLRYLIQETAGSTVGEQPYWRLNYRFDPNGDSTGWGTWARLSIWPGRNTIFPSIIADATTTTQQIGSGTFTDGEFTYSGLTDVLAATVGNDEYECEWYIRFAESTIGGKIQFRVTDPGDTFLDTVNLTTSVNINQPNPPSIAGYRFYNNDGTDLTATPLDSENSIPTVQLQGSNLDIQLRILLSIDSGLFDHLLYYSLQHKLNNDSWQDTSLLSSAVTDGAEVLSDSDWWDITKINKDYVISTVEGLYDSDTIGTWSSANCVRFSPDGTQFFTISSNLALTHRYDLASPWDIADIEARAPDSNLDTSGGIYPGLGQSDKFTFNDSGTELYYLMPTNGQRIVNLSMTTPWKISTADRTNFKTKHLSAHSSALTGISFNKAGTEVYLTDATNRKLLQFSLSTPWDLDTLDSSAPTGSFAHPDEQLRDIQMKSDGTKVYNLDIVSGNDKLIERSLTTPFDISTVDSATLKSSFISTPSPTGPDGFFIDSNGQWLFIISGPGGQDHVTRYSIGLTKTSLLKNDSDAGGTVTNRVVNGINDPASGTFINGYQNSNIGLGRYSLNNQWDGGRNGNLKPNSFSESVFGVQLKAADLVANDTISFRIIAGKNGLNHDSDRFFTLTETPQILIGGDLASGGQIRIYFLG